MFLDVFEPHDERAKDSANALTHKDKRFFFIYSLKLKSFITELEDKVIYFGSNLKEMTKEIFNLSIFALQGCGPTPPLMTLTLQHKTL